MIGKTKQESLANAEVSARQQCRVRVRRPLAKKSVTNQRKEHNVEKCIQWVITYNAVAISSFV